VLQLIGSFEQGGSERQAVQLTRLLHESGRYRVHVACLDGGGPLRGVVERLGLGEIPAFALTSFHDRNTVRQLFRFASFLRRRRVDIVQTHDFYTNVFGMAGATLAGVRARVAARRETAGLRTGAQKKTERCAYRLAHAVVANAGAVAQQLIDEGVPRAKIVTIYNGLDLGRLTPPPGLSRAQALALLKLPEAEPLRLVTIVANLRHAVKDHPTFLRAARRVADAVPDAAFVIAGEGELEAPLRDLAARLGIGGRVFFTGRCERVAELLFASEVCVLSSTAEGFSNAILEYMAAARPVVATDVGGAREAVAEGETGHLVAPGDDGALASRIVWLLNERERALAFGARGRDVVRERFSCGAQLERTERLYERLLARRRRAPAEVAGGVHCESA
jgi:glycosyltransferase involved in cell wall biosynthesis